MRADATSRDHRRVAEDLVRDGCSVRRHVVPAELVDALRRASDEAVAAEAASFPPGSDQDGRVLCAPAFGGPFIDLCGFDPLFAPIEAILGDDSILYAMTTSTLRPGSAGPIDHYHVDVAADRPDGLALSAIVLLDPFTEDNGATEVVVGSHRWRAEPLDDEQAGRRILGQPGDVCYFDPRVWHRTTMNSSARPRRAIPLQMVRPWMKQRLDVPGMLAGAGVRVADDHAARRLGLTSRPPGSLQEFLDRRSG